MKARVIVGIGGGITKVAAPALLHELAHPRLRATMGTMYYGFYHFGGAVSGVMCSGSMISKVVLTAVAGLFVQNTEWQWRMPCFLQVFGPSVVLAIVVISPESPRWLASKGRIEQARAILVKHHANGKEDDELVEYEYREIVSTLEQESLKNKSRYVSLGYEWR
jgi:MFS family permease